MDIKKQRGLGAVREALKNLRLIAWNWTVILRQYYPGTCHNCILKLNINSFDSSFYLFLAIVSGCRLCRFLLKVISTHHSSNLNWKPQPVLLPSWSNFFFISHGNSCLCPMPHPQVQCKWIMCCPSLLHIINLWPPTNQQLFWERVLYLTITWLLTECWS